MLKHDSGPCIKPPRARYGVDGEGSRRAATFGTVKQRSANAPVEPLQDLVERLDDNTMRRLLVRSATEHDDVALAIRLAAATPADALATLRTEVDDGLRTRRHLDYWASSQWAHDALPVVDALADAVKSAPTQELVTLLERAIGHVVKVLLRADDSNGEIGDLVRQLLELHGEVCDAGVADSVDLANWMVRFSFRDQDFFHADPVRYSAALGERGLAIYRKEVDKRSKDERMFAHRYARERLAVLDRDVSQLIELFGADLASPYHFIRLTEALLEIDRPDDALDWARRGISETTGWQVARLYDLAAGVLTARADATAVLELRRDQHQRMPSATTYGLLRQAASEEAWMAEVGPARELLALRDKGGLVDVLLVDGETDAAWALAMTDTTWQPGGDRWARLAEAREPTDPKGAMDVYLQLAKEALLVADRQNYKVAVRHLKAARRAATAAGLSNEFTEHLLAIRDENRRRPTLISLLDKAKLT